MGIRLCAEALVAPGALADKRVLITGGVPKSALMREILCNALPARVSFRAFSDMSALGAVAHAAVASGMSASAGDFLAGFDYGEVAAENEHRRCKRSTTGCTWCSSAGRSGWRRADGAPSMT